MKAIKGALLVCLSTVLLVGCDSAPTGRQQSNHSNNLSQFKAKSKMNKTEFWRIINFAHQQAPADDQMQEELLIKNLEQYSAEDIIEFECILRQTIIEADDFGVMAAEKIIEGYVTDDPYVYFRCWLIGQGEQVYTRALRNPDSLAEVVTPETQVDFEPLLYVATTAYRNKTGKQEEDATFPRDVAATRGLDYDFGSKTKGKDWTPEQLPTLLPRLWAMFN
jgi:hypothetical protein